MTIKEMLEKRAKCITDARVVLDKAKDEKREPTAEERKQFDTLMDDAAKLKTDADVANADEKRKTDLADAEKNLSESRGRQVKHQDDTKTENKEFKFSDGRKIILNASRSTAAYIKSFGSFLANGAPMDALQEDSDTAGGYTSPAMFNAQLIQAVDDLVFIRQKATKFLLSTGESLGFPSLENDPADSDWTTEIATGSEDSTMSFGKRELSPYPLAKLLKVSKKLIRSSAVGIDSLVKDRLAYKFGVSEEKGFLTGSGSGQPLGVFTASANGISTSRDVSTGNTTTAITFDGLKNAQYNQKAAHRSNSEWIFHRDSLKMISKLKDGDGQYIRRQSTEVGSPDMLLGIPYNESEYAPNTFTTGLYVGILGDFSYYWIVDALTLSIQVLIELYAATNQNGYIGRLECDGMPVLEEAFSRVTLA